MTFYYSYLFYHNDVTRYSAIKSSFKASKRKYRRTGSEELAVAITSGAHNRFTFLLTTNIHGDETFGVIITHRLLTSPDLHQLCGRVIVFPYLNPSEHMRDNRL